MLTSVEGYIRRNGLLIFGVLKFGGSKSWVYFESVYFSIGKYRVCHSLRRSENVLWFSEIRYVTERS